MSTINISSILKKINSSTQAKKLIDDAVNRAGSKGGSSLAEIDNLTFSFVSELRSNIVAAGLGGVDGMDDITIGKPVNIGNKQVTVDINFSNKGALHRDSLLSKPRKGGGISYPDGIDNIAAFLNKGMPGGSANDYVYGSWHGRWIRSRKDFSGYHYMEDTANDFMRKYASKGVIKVEIDPEYTY